MDISSITNSMLAQSLVGQSSQGSATQGLYPDPAAAAFKKANDRVDQQLSSTNVQLSAYGQIKSAFSNVQAAADTVTDAKQVATTADAKQAIGNFVSAYNQTNKALASATQNQTRTAKAGALADDARAQVAANNLRRSVSEGNNLAELKKIGITQNKDGTLAIDAKTLDKALQANPDQVRSTIANVGQKVEKVAARELGDSGNVGSSVNALNNRNRNLQAQQSTQEDQISAAQRQLSQQATAVNNIFAGGLVAYQRTFSG